MPDIDGLGRTRPGSNREHVVGLDDADDERELLDLAALGPPTWRERLDDLLVRARDLPVPALVVAAVVALAVAVVVVVLGLRSSRPPVEEVLPVATTVASDDGARATSAPSTTTGPVVAHAAGAVRTPGLHELPAGARVADLLDASGGALDDADLDRLNLAAPLTDGARVYVPRRGETEIPTALGPVAPSSDTGANEAEEAVEPVALNQAGSEELERLPGVGPATATAILEHRRSNGPFRHVDDLLDVRGIGEAKLEQIRELVVLG